MFLALVLHPGAEFSVPEITTGQVWGFEDAHLTTGEFGGLICTQYRRSVEGPPDRGVFAEIPEFGRGELEKIEASLQEVLNQNMQAYFPPAILPMLNGWDISPREIIKTAGGAVYGTGMTHTLMGKESSWPEPVWFFSGKRGQLTADGSRLVGWEVIYPRPEMVKLVHIWTTWVNEPPTFRMFGEARILVHNISDGDGIYPDEDCGQRRYSLASKLGRKWEMVG